jgi:CBS domain containing-hemolysin-like protein
MLLVSLQIFILVVFSAICSGLNVSLLAIDLSDLQRKAKLGNRAAKRVLPLRRNSHLTLAAILLINVGAVSATSLVLEHHLNGVIAGLLSTLLIVIFGEIVPQALLSKRALHYMALATPLLKVMIIITYPVAKPLQLLLDKLFGGETRKLQSRHELGIMISEHLGKDSELDEDEVEIIRGALQLSEKRVRDIMTPMSQVFWLTPDTILDDAKIDEIKEAGRSRIPIFNQRLTHCYGVLLMKELVDIDFEEKVYRVDDLPLHPSQIVGSMTALDTMFRKFIGAKSHLIPVEKDDDIIGIVTIEDLIEEILGHEIEDETDHQKRQIKRS